MARVTRDEYLDTAETLFAERGFYGVSIAAIADQLGLTKQALLHHFGSKEKLYGEVLKRISHRFDEMLSAPASGADDPADRVRDFFNRLAASADQQPDQTRLLMRELLDNNQRAATASTWYLKPFLIRLTEMIQALPAWQGARDADALAAGYQILGAINYFAISHPTLTGIYGDRGQAALRDAYPVQLRSLIEDILRTGPAGGG